ncbi:MAG: hypothetical protein RIS76_638 [Verrucomicrobiota bacterium]
MGDREKSVGRQFKMRPMDITGDGPRNKAQRVQKGECIGRRFGDECATWSHLAADHLFRASQAIPEDDISGGCLLEAVAEVEQAGHQQGPGHQQGQDIYQ